MIKRSWRKVKTLALLVNRRQWEREFDPEASSALELLTEDGQYYIRTETSTTSVPQYIITE